MENPFIFKPKKNKINYDDVEDQDWVSYIRQSLSHDPDHDVPYPDSSWSFAKKESVFNQENFLKRTDEDLREDVAEALYQSSDIDGSNITVEVLSGNVVLTGNVSSEFEKKRTQDLVSQMKGVWSITDQLKVQLN